MWIAVSPHGDRSSRRGQGTGLLTRPRSAAAVWPRIRIGRGWLGESPRRKGAPPDDDTDV